MHLIRRLIFISSRTQYRRSISCVEAQLKGNSASVRPRSSAIARRPGALGSSPTPLHRARAASTMSSTGMTISCGTCSTGARAVFQKLVAVAPGNTTWTAAPVLASSCPKIRGFRACGSLSGFRQAGEKKGVWGVFTGPKAVLSNRAIGVTRFERDLWASNIVCRLARR
jgi:hypothetical protein